MNIDLTDPSEITVYKNEAEWQEHIRKTAEACGWEAGLKDGLWFHAHSSQRSSPGFPDVTLLDPGDDERPARLLFIECKMPGQRLRPDQERWIGALQDFAQRWGLLATQVRSTLPIPSVEVYVWRPEDIDEVEEVLTR